MLFRRTETPSDDSARDGRLLDSLETAYAVRTGDPVDGGDLTPFEEIVLHAVGRDPGTSYPPAGHTYPRR